VRDQAQREQLAVGIGCSEVKQERRAQSDTWDMSGVGYPAQPAVHTDEAAIADPRFDAPCSGTIYAYTFNGYRTSMTTKKTPLFLAHCG
jgi:hypothetical protein